MFEEFCLCIFHHNFKRLLPIWKSLNPLLFGNIAYVESICIKPFTFVDLSGIFWFYGAIFRIDRDRDFCVCPYKQYHSNL